MAALNDSATVSSSSTEDGNARDIYNILGIKDITCIEALAKKGELNSLPKLAPVDLHFVTGTFVVALKKKLNDSFYDVLKAISPFDDIGSINALRKRILKITNAKVKDRKAMLANEFDMKDKTQNNVSLSTSLPLPSPPQKRCKKDENFFESMYKDSQKKIVELENTIEKKDIEIRALKGELRTQTSLVQELKSSLDTYNKRIAGTKSALSKAKSKKEAEDRGNLLIDNSITEIVAKTGSTSNPNVFTGYCLQRGNDTQVFKKIQGSHSDVKYFKIGRHSKSLSELDHIGVSRRTSNALELIKMFAGGTNEATSEKDLIILFSKIFKSLPKVFEGTLLSLGINVFHQLNTTQAVQLQSLLRLTTYKFRQLRIFFNNVFNVRLLPSESKMRVTQGKFLTYIRENSETGKIALMNSDRTSVTESPYYRVVDLVKFINAIYKKLVDSNEVSNDPGFMDKIWILFAGDKGGTVMKFHLEILNAKSVGSVDNVHCFCFYKGSDISENMEKLLSYYLPTLKTILNPDFKVGGRNVKILLGGDFKFIHAMLGHQGSSASYPSIKDYVELQHLREHSAHPHTPAFCGDDFVERTMPEIFLYNQEFNSDPRSKAGRHHYSVGGNILFPLSDIHDIVPPILHINLGVVLLIFNQLVVYIRDLDKEEGGHTVDKDAESKLSELDGDIMHLEKLISDLAWEFIYFYNLMDRVDNANDRKKLNEIARHSTPGRGKQREKNVEKCAHLDSCCITSYDENVLWVMCEQCMSWKHIMCECMLMSAEAVDLLPEYICLKCQGKGNRGEIIKIRISEIENAQQNFRSQKQTASENYSRYKEIAYANIGPREQSLNLVLKELNVHRQAYHGNVFVGNHCKIINKNYDKLVAVISDKPEFHLRYSNVFDVFSKCQPLLLAKRFLSDQEINLVETLCHDFGDAFHNCFPEKGIIPKIHEYIFHVPKFVRKHKTLGLCSEEEGESLHASFNLELRGLVSVRDPAEQMRILQERQEMRCQVDKSLLMPEKRLCLVCKGNGIRSFLKLSGGKTSSNSPVKCPKCGTTC